MIQFSQRGKSLMRLLQLEGPSYRLGFFVSTFWQKGGLLEELKDENYLAGLSKKDFTKRLAYYWAELNVLHPFREGNGRTTREFLRQLALKNGYILNFQNVDSKKLLDASIKSIVNTTDLEKYLYECLEENK